MSALLYISGAINEAISDIFGAAVERTNGNKSIADTWLIGEDLFLIHLAGQGVRSMADPTLYGQVDYYPEKYTGTNDNGGVHINRYASF
jgi:bacillolysin